MKSAPGLRPLVLPLLGVLFAASPASAQDACPRASGVDAEAGWSAYGEGDLEEARERFQAAMATCGDDHYARTGLAYVELREGAVTNAQALWTTVVQAQPSNVDALTGLGLAAWRLGDLDAVEANFSRVVALVPDHPTALEYLSRLSGAEAAAAGAEDPANAAWNAGDTDSAFQLYLARLEGDALDPVASLRVALVTAWQGDYRRALRLLDGLIERDPRYVDAQLARARVLAWSGDLERAEDEVLEVLAVRPDYPEALEALALFRSWAGDVEDALSSYDELNAIAPHSGSVARGRAQALAWASRFEASRAAYDSLLARDPNDLEARLGLAQTLAYAQDFEGAIVEYDRVLAASSGEVRALVGKARTLGWAGSLVEGERVARQAVETDRSSAEAWAGLGQAYAWQGRTAAAKNALDIAADLAPTNAEVLNQRRSVDLVLSPLARPTVIYEDDSDGNRMVTTRLSAGWHPTPRLEVLADGYYKDLRQGAFLRTAAGGGVRGTYEFDPGWELTAGVGGSRTDGTGDPSLFEYRATVRSPERYPVVASLGYNTAGLNETATLAEIGARSKELLLTTRWSPLPGWRVDGSVGVGEYEGVEANGRRSAFVSASRLIGRFFSLGASFRAFSFEKNLDEGYFDPDFYGIAELTSYWLYRPGSWTLLVEAAPGLQKVRADGEWGTSIRANGRIAYRMGPGQEVFFAVGYSDAGLVSFSSTAADYRYTTLMLGSSWTF